MHHPRTLNPPHGAIWRRGDRQDRGKSPLRHEELVVLFGISGTARYLLEGQESEIRTGTVLWAPAGSAHMLVDTSVGFDQWVVLAHPALFGGMIPTEFQAASGSRGLPSAEVVRLHALADEVDRAGKQALGAGLIWLLWQAYRCWDAAKDQTAKAWHPAVARVALEINQNPDRPLRAIKANSGLSASHLAQLFKSQTGQDLHSFRSLRQLQSVDRAVAEGTHLLTAAMDAGFGSYAQFFRVFRNHRGQSPREFYKRREAGAEQAAPAAFD